MPSEAFDRFLQSLKGSYEQWHDGTGYDLSALRESTADELLEAEAILIQRLAYEPGWRDVEALAVLGTPTAQAAVQNATEHRDVEVRKYARDLLAPPPPPRTLADDEEDTIRTIEMGAINDAVFCPTARVKRALLDRARLAPNGEARAKAAAMLLFVCGQATSNYDQTQSTFLDRFKSAEMKDLRSAWSELRERTGV